MIFDPQVVGRQTTYRLLTGSVVPRPIAWISTVSPAGVANLAPFSFFTVASREPASLAVSIGAASDQDEAIVKETLSNMRATGEFVVNIPGQELAVLVDRTGAALPIDQDDFQALGLAPVAGVRVAAPRVALAKAAFECRVAQEVAIGTDTLVIGQVELVHVADDCVDEAGHVDLGGLQPLARASGPRYVYDIATSVGPAREVWA